MLPISRARIYKLIINPIFIEASESLRGLLILGKTIRVLRNSVAFKLIKASILN